MAEFRAGYDVLETLRAEVAKRVAAAALLFQTEHRRRLSVPNPSPHLNPAPRGQYPRLRTGFGRGQVLLDLSKIKQPDPVATVGIGEPGAYLEILAGKGWKGVQDTLDEIGPRLAQVVAGNTGRAT